MTIDRLTHVPIHVRATKWRLLYGGYVVSSQGVFLRRVVKSRVELLRSRAVLRHGSGLMA